MNTIQFSTTKKGNISPKTLRRNVRLVRLNYLSQAYFKYQLFYLKQCVINHATSYNEAESTSLMINTIFNGETTPSDFIQSEDEAANEVIENYKDYQSFLEVGFLDEKVVDAFCKASEHSFGSILKINSVAFVNQIRTLIAYNSGQITKEQAEDNLVDYCIFSRKKKKLNTRLFKNTIYSIEKLYTEILNKKTIRLINKK